MSSSTLNLIIETMIKGDCSEYILKKLFDMFHQLSDLDKFANSLLEYRTSNGDNCSHADIHNVFQNRRCNECEYCEPYIFEGSHINEDVYNIYLEKCDEYGIDPVKQYTYKTSITKILETDYDYDD